MSELPLYCHSGRAEFDIRFTERSSISSVHTVRGCEHLRERELEREREHESESKSKSERESREREKRETERNI